MNEIRGYSDQVARLRQAAKNREQQNAKEQELRSGKNHTGLPTLIEPFDFKTDQRAARNEEDLLIEIDVTVPPNYVTKLCIYSGDDITKVVKEFSLKWDLRATTSQLLEQ